MASDETEFETLTPTLCKRLTTNFYRWEKRCRGWTFWLDVVDLEPVYEPFIHRYSEYPAVVDDGRKHTFLSNLAERISRALRGSKLQEQNYVPYFELPEDELEPPIFSDSSALKYLTVSLSPKDKVNLDNAEHFLLSLNYCALPISFEIIGKSEVTTVQLVCRESDLQQLKSQFEVYFPDAVVYEEGEDLSCLIDGGKEAVVVDFGLAQEFMRPVRTFKGLDPDSLTAIFGALEGIEQGEIGVFQVLFQPARHPWAESIIRSVTDQQGKSFFADCPDMPHLAREKVQRQLFSVCIRVAAQSKKPNRAWEITRALTAGLTPLARPESNAFLPLANDGYDNAMHAEDVCLRQSRRSGMLLNSQELTAIVHPPSSSVRTAKLRRELKKTKPAPAIATGNDFVIGKNIHEGKETTVSLSREQRLRHTHIIGATGTGKSTLLLKMIVQDIESGLGVGVLDPHGDLIDKILGYIPEERFEDVVLVDPSDSEYPVGLNILSAYSDIDKTVLSSDLVGVFRRLSTSWGDQMNSIFGNAILAFLESETGGTLMDLRSFLVEKDFRYKFLKTVKDKDVVYYWQKVFPQLGGRLYAPILTRLDTFLRPKPIRYMVAQKEGLNFRQILDEKKIFLAKLAHGLIGMENAYLLGTITCSKFHQAAMARQELKATERGDFFLYIDEFQNFVTESMAEILSGARKYRFGLILAHQELHQLWGRDSQLASSVISNPATRICFRLGDFDAKKLEDGFASFDAKDLQNLGVGEAIARIERMEFDFNLKTDTPPEISSEVWKKRIEKIISLSRSKYGRRREDIEAALAQERSISQPVFVAEQKVNTPEPENVETQVLPVTEVKHVTRPREAESRRVTQHKSLQNLIRQSAEAYGFRALIEEPTEDGSGRVDIHLEKDNKRIACEVSDTTSVEQEFGNIKNRLRAGYDTVILCSQDEKFLENAKNVITKKLSKSERPKALYMPPDKVVSYLKQLAARSESKEVWIKGRKVKVGFKPVDDTMQRGTRESILKVLFGNLRKPKD